MDLKTALHAADNGSQKYTGKGDSVTWTAWRADGTQVNVNWDQTNCYSRGMRELSELEIHCLPAGGPSETQMPSLWYHHFFRLLKQSGLVPYEVKTLHRQGANCLIIPRNGWDRHTLYITLCLYRQCDQKPREAMRAMLLWKRLAPHGTHFLQCLHHMAVTTGMHDGHHFLLSGAYGGAPKQDLANGQALAWFAKQTKQERLDALDPTKDSCMSNWTNSYLACVAKKMKSVKVKGLEEIMDPQYAHLYKNPEKKESGVE